MFKSSNKINKIPIEVVLFLLSIILLTTSCSQKNNLQLQNGDLLFTGKELQIEKSDFENSINSVTQTDKATNYTHVGIVEIDQNGIWVIHASPKKGVFRDSLETFTKEEQHVFVYRLMPEYKQFIPQALIKLKDYLGQFYDFSFLLNDSSQYCSGLIYNLFQNEEIFQLNPMTFKDSSGNILHYWIDYYKNLNMEIPENIPGCNPNGMAKSDAIYFVGKL